MQLGLHLPHAGGKISTGTRRPKTGARVRANDNVGGPPGRGAVAGGVHRDRRRPDAGGEPLAPLVIGDDRGHPRPTVEQLRLGLEVVVEIGMEVEMVLREVRERPDREVQAIGSAQRQGVAGHLHGD